MTENNFNFTNGVSYDVWYETKRLIDQLKKENEELKAENEEVNDRMADVIYRATGGRLSYSNYTLDTIEQAFNDQLDILSERKVEEEINEIKSKYYRYEQDLEPFKDGYFKGLTMEQIAELAKKSIRLTTENRKLENKLSDIAGICSQILDGEDYVRRIAKTILDIID
jgi:cell division protein FtsB